MLNFLDSDVKKSKVKDYCRTPDTCLGNCFSDKCDNKQNCCVFVARSGGGGGSSSSDCGGDAFLYQIWAVIS